TIQYILEDGPRRLLYRDLRIRSPYNTYMTAGLPPGPINNPGRQTILATLYPEEHSFLFFVADGKGGHTFTRTYTEHQRAVREFRRVRREQQRAAGLQGTAGAPQ
ncbi:MAG: endolytic transglycosylase MltG, partial [Bacteroidota bacterium]